MQDIPTFISAEQAFEIIKTKAQSFGAESVNLHDSNGRILAETLYADRDFPPFDRVSMDGIAIQFNAFKSGQRIFKIDATCPAGSPQTTLKTPTNCIEIMTGASLPIGCDCVIRYEDVSIKNGSAQINIEDINQGQNIHKKGSDIQQNDSLVAAGTRINPSLIGVAASIGKTHLKVYINPTAIIISTGDELVDVNATPLPHQIRKSNVFVIENILKELHINSKTAHINDDYDTLIESIGGFIRAYDLIILSGGVSMGKYDYIPKVMEKLGVETHFHKVTQRPGKPFWFGSHLGCTTIFALPGNPISTTMTAYVYLRYWLHHCVLTPYPTVYAKLDTGIHFKPNLTYFLEVVIHYDSIGQIIATPKKGNGSGDLANLVGIDGFIELPKGKELYKAGEVYRVYLV